MNICKHPRTYESILNSSDVSPLTKQIYVSGKFHVVQLLYIAQKFVLGNFVYLTKLTFIYYRNIVIVLKITKIHEVS
jgi:vancomycin permeability regulator SanA